jgi:hypothetical protein
MDTAVAFGGRAASEGSIVPVGVLVSMDSSGDRWNGLQYCAIHLLVLLDCVASHGVLRNQY